MIILLDIVNEISAVPKILSEKLTTLPFSPGEVSSGLSLVSCLIHTPTFGLLQQAVYGDPWCVALGGDEATFLITLSHILQ